ncbi:MAG: ABC transporter ATP-binding protein [Muribaculaceae bacterium]
MEQSYLSTQDLTVGYKHKGNSTAVLSHLNLQINRGELAALLGANGAGKSTLLRTITCTQPPLQGSVNLCGIDLFKLTQLERSRLISIVTTDRVMAGALTVNELVSLGRQPHTGILGRLSKRDKEVVAQAMADAGIAHKAQHYVAQLSDGERQKAMIAKSLAQDTPVIILDEPTAFLDVASRFETMRLLHSLAHNHNKAVLLSSHDIAQSLLLADRLWVIDSHGNMTCGFTEDLIIDGQLQKLFNSQALRFNAITSDFETVLPTTQAVSVESNHPALARCISNALMRNGYAIKAGSDVTVKATTAGCYQVNSQSASSIEQLIATINNIFKNPQTTPNK